MLQLVLFTAIFVSVALLYLIIFRIILSDTSEQMLNSWYLVTPLASLLQNTAGTQLPDWPLCSK